MAKQKKFKLRIISISNQWQGKTKGRTLAGFTFGPDASAVGFDQMLGQKQAQSRASGLGSGARTLRFTGSPPKTRKEHGPLFGCNARALVGD
jgi:hypothetical protein